MMKIVAGVLIIAVIVSALLSGTFMSQVPTPVYQVVKKAGDIEIRSYDSMIFAEVNVTGKREDSIQSGFQQLAGYIFGSNHSRSSDQMQKQEAGEKIAMTAPVIQQPDSNGQNVWKVKFVMPSDYKLETLPIPDNVNIQLFKVPGKKFVVIRFSGRSTHYNLSSHLKLLEDYVKDNKIRTVGQPVYAYYNPPWTLPFLRRNEIMFEIR